METADCGAFYSGRNLWSYGSEIRYNYIHDVGEEGTFACGIYWDDGLSGQKAYGNLLINVAKYAFLVGGGRDCYVYNNVIINSGDSPIHHDARMRQYTMNYHNAWFSHVGPMSEEMKPYLENETWMKAFPEYEGLILYPATKDGDLPRTAGRHFLFLNKSNQYSSSRIAASWPSDICGYPSGNREDSHPRHTCLPDTGQPTPGPAHPHPPA